MEYDYHGNWDGYTGHNAPLYASPKDDTPEKKAWNIVSIGFENLCLPYNLCINRMKNPIYYTCHQT